MKLIIIYLLVSVYQTFAQSCEWDDEALLPLTHSHPTLQQQHVTDFWSYDKFTSTWKMINSIGSCPATSEQENQWGNFNSELSDRVSVMKFSETSLWITGHSGSLYEMSWNGLQWVIIPHDLPSSEGLVARIFLVNRTLLALSEEGKLYKLEVDPNGQFEWSCAGPWYSSFEESWVELRKSAVLSKDKTSMFFTAAAGWLFELSTLHPLRWINHSHPRGGDVAQVIDAGSLKNGLIFTVSSSGELYEHDPTSKPAWKKHLRTGSMIEEEFAPSRGVAVHELAGARSFSLFLMTKSSSLVERRLERSKWQWLLHSKPKARLGFSLGPVVSNSKNISFFLISQQGSVYEYKLSFLHGSLIARSSNNQNPQFGDWRNHSRPPDANVIPSVPGVVLNSDRVFFMLQDGRAAELSPPRSRSTVARKSSYHDEDLVWSVHEAPESEGGNAEYCTATLGPLNCLEGIEDRSGYLGTLSKQLKSFTNSSEKERWKGSMSTLFRARTLHFSKSMFLVGEDGVPSERFFNGKLWLWLKHEVSPTPGIAGILGVYNGSIFMNDVEGSLMTREWNGSSLHWLNCTSLEGGFRVVSGSPSDGLLGEIRTVTLEDALVFVSNKGELVEFLVALRSFKWRSCGHPLGTLVSAIVDQEAFRYRVVFVVGSNGKLYHFNRITRQWYGYQQPEHFKLSGIPGTVCRPSFQSTAGSLFMRSDFGSLVELSWENRQGWSWSDHGVPAKDCHLATSPGPCMENGDVLVVGSDGRVYTRHRVADHRWEWRDFGHPLAEQGQNGNKFYVVGEGSTPGDAEVLLTFKGDCNFLIDSTRPLAMNKDLAVFVLKDGRIAELKLVDERWDWVSIIDTPSSRCHSSYYQPY